MNKLTEASINAMSNLLLIGGLFSYLIFVSTANEFVMYVFTIVYYAYLAAKKKLSIIDFCLAIIFIFPSLLRLSLLFLVAIVYLIIKYNKLYNQILHKLFNSLMMKVYCKHLFFSIGFFIIFTLGIIVLNPVINIYYREYKTILDIGFGLYFISVISVFVFFLLFSLSLDLVKAAFIVKELPRNLIVVVASYLAIILIFMVLPDALYSVLYSFSFSMMTTKEHEILEMFYHSFLLHYQVPMNDHYLAIQDSIQHSFVLGLINGVHIYTVKIVDGVIIAAIVVTLFVNKVLSAGAENKSISLFEDTKS